MKIFCSFLAALACALAVSAAEPELKPGDPRCFELRIYYAAPDKLDDLNARFREHTMAIFKKHGMENLGYWVPLDNSENKLIYLLAYPSREARDAAWKAFSADPEWQAVVKASEANGRLVTRVVSRFLKATDYSPGVEPKQAREPRTFELRTYTASPKKLEALNARFREHTLMLFRRSGMENIGYWTPMKGDPGAENTLIYLLAHKSKEARDESFKRFGQDPDWLAAKKASEVDGPLTVKVESVLMKPTDYSPMK